MVLVKLILLEFHKINKLHNIQKRTGYVVIINLF